jgi:hypothetical protein
LVDRSLLGAAIGALALFCGAPIEAAAQPAAIDVTAPAGNPVVVAEGHDYFVRDLGMRRDMNELSDIRWLDGVLNFEAVDGHWRGATAEGARLFGMWPGMALGAANIGPTGDQFPMNADRYRELSFRVFTPYEVDYVWWGLPGLYSEGGTVVARGQTIAGWQTLIHRLDHHWSGRQQGLMLDLSQGVTDLRIDWIRLTDSSRGPVVNTAWSGGGSPAVDIYVDTDRRLDNGLYAQLAAGVPNDGTQALSLHALPPGRYFVYVTESGDPESGDYSPIPVIVAGAPVAEFVAPSMQSGADYATEELDNAWDMDTKDDLFTGGIWDWIWGGLTHFPTFQNGLMTAITNNTNPFVLLNVDPLRPIDTTRYRYLSWRWMVDPNFYPNGRLSDENGWVTRFHYFSDWPITEATRNTLNDIIIWDLWETYEMDLAEGYLDDEIPGLGSGWRGTKTVLEFDPLEGTRPFGFQVDWVSLTAAPEALAGGSYPLEWTVLHGDRPLTVTLSYDTDRDADNGVAGSIAVLAPETPQPPPREPAIGAWQIYLPRLEVLQPVHPATNFAWRVPANLAGDVYIVVEVSDGLQATRRYSQVPVTIYP